MNRTRIVCRSGGHRRGDLWTSGRRTTMHSGPLYDQMVVAQTAEEQRIRSEGSTPTEMQRLRSAARAYKEHYNASMDHLGIQPQTVNSVDTPNLTSRPSYLGPTILSGYAGEATTATELGVGMGVRKDQFLYYDDSGRRLQHPVTAQMMTNAGLMTASEVNEELEASYAASLAERQAALAAGDVSALEANAERPRSLAAGPEAEAVGGNSGDALAATASSPSGVAPVAGRGGAPAPQPSAEVAAMTRVRDKRDLLYNQKLKPHWDAAHEDPVRGSGMRGPRRNIDDGSVVTRGTERTAFHHRRGAGAESISNRSDGQGGYYEVSATVAETGARTAGGSLAPRAGRGREEGLKGGDAEAPTTHVFGLGEDLFRRSQANASNPSQPLMSGADVAPEAAASADTPSPPPPPRSSNISRRKGGSFEGGAVGAAVEEEIPFVSSAEKDEKYSSQRVDLNNPRVGPEFFRGADVAMDADLRKALDTRMRAAKEGRPVEPLSKTLADEERRDGNDRYGAVTEGKLNERVESLLDEKAAAARAAAPPSQPAAPRGPNMAAPKGSRVRRGGAADSTTAQPTQPLWKRFLGLTDTEAPTLTAEEEAAERRRAEEEQQRLVRDGFAFEDSAAAEDARHNSRLGLRSSRATSSNSPVGRRKPVTYDAAADLSAERLMMQIMGAGMELNAAATDSRELFSGGWDFWGNRRKGSNSYTDAGNAGGRFANRLAPNYFANDSLHAGMQASSLQHRKGGGAAAAKGAAGFDDAAGVGPSAVRNKAFAKFQQQSREDPYGAARNIGVGAGGLSAISNAQASGGAGVGSSFSHSSEGERAVNQFTFRQVLKQLDHSRMQPTNHDDMFGDALKYCEAYVDMSGMLRSAEGAASSINVTGEDSAADDVLLPRAALKGRMVGLLFYTESKRSRVFMERLEAFAKPLRGDFVVLGLSYGAYERRDVLKKHGFCCIPTNMGARYVARDAGFHGSFWLPYPSLFIVDGSTGRVITKYGYAGVSRRPDTCFTEWLEGSEGITPLDVVLSRFDLLSAPIDDADNMTKRVVEDFHLNRK